MVKIKKNLWSGIALLIGSIVLYLLIPSQINLDGIMEVAVDAQFMPRLIFLLMGILSIVLIISSLVFKKDEILEFNVKDELRTLGFFGICLVYVFLLQIVGYVIASIVMITVALLYFGTRKWYFYAIGYATAVITYVLFGIILNVGLPTLF